MSGQGGFRVPLDVLKREFEPLLLDFCDTYLPGGQREGHEYIVGGVHGGAGRSMAVRIDGQKRGTWCDFAGASDHRGDAIDLVRHVLFHGNKADAIRWMIGETGLADTGHNEMTIKRAKAREKVKRDREEAEKEAAAKRQRAYAIWRIEAEAEIAGTPVESYLNGRCIWLNMLSSTGALRYHPALYNDESGRRWPAMVAAIVNGEGKFIAVHRTWLEVRPDGRVTKAPLKTPKKALGIYKGGYISISKGASGEAMTRAPMGDRVLLTEGIEDALTYAMCDPELRVIAGISLDNMANAPVPSHVGQLQIGGDNDEGEAEQAKLNKALATHIRHGIADVRLTLAPEGFKDINAYWMATQNAERRSA